MQARSMVKPPSFETCPHASPHRQGEGRMKFCAHGFAALGFRGRASGLGTQVLGLGGMGSRLLLRK